MASPHSVRRIGGTSGLVSPDPGNGRALAPRLTVDLIELSTSGAETRTLLDPPMPGLELTIAMCKDGGDCVVTAESPINSTGNNTITFATEGDMIVLRSIRVGSACVWRAISTIDAALSTVS